MSGCGTGEGHFTEQNMYVQNIATATLHHCLPTPPSSCYPTDPQRRCHMSDVGALHHVMPADRDAKPVRPEEAILRKLGRHSGCRDCGCDVLQILWDSVLLKNLHLLLLHFFQRLPIFAWMRDERTLNQVEHPVHGLSSILLPGSVPVT